MPIFKEDPARVAAGLRVVYESLAATGQLEHFEFFLLSDSDHHDNWIAEEAAWTALVNQLDALGRIFYRKRRVNIKGESYRMKEKRLTGLFPGSIALPDSPAKGGARTKTK